jgi:dipeptidyl aminopeptidase/acylaminoacyl peptidase
MLRSPHLSPRDFASLPGFAFPLLSWSRREVALFRDHTGRFELYTLDLATRKWRQLTDGQAPRGLRSGFCWTRDDAALIYARDRKGDEQHDLYRLEIASGEVQRLTSDPKVQHHAVEVSPDNRFLSVNSTREGQLDLFRFDLAACGWQRLAHFGSPCSGGRWSTDGSWVYFQANESNDLRNSDAYRAHRDGGRVERIFHVADGAKDLLGRPHPDGGRWAVMSDAGGCSRAGILERLGGEVRWLGHGDVDEHAIEFSPDGRWLSILREVDAAVVPLLYEVATGRERLLRIPAGIAGGLRFLADGGKLLLSHTSSSRRPGLHLYDLEQDTLEALLPPEYGAMDPSRFVAAEHIRYPAHDGEQVPALLYLPPEPAPGEGGMPAIILAHGGPTAHWMQAFDPYAQLLVDRGILVLQPNVRGSTGYGAAWRDANLKDWGGGDLEDVASGVEYLRRRGDVDMSRIGIFGGSYGGYLSFIAAVKKPDLFKVAIPWVGISDLHRLYEENMQHFRYYFRQQMGDPEADEALWRDRSAVTHVQNLRAKLLIGHGINDPRCPISQARGFRDRLLALGRREGTAPGDDFEYHEFDMGHGPSGDIEGKIRTYETVLDFLDRRL